MSEPTGDELDALNQERADLDGHTLEELADYLDTDRIPRDESIESSAACLHALDALQRLRTVAGGLLGPPAEPTGSNDDWVDRVLDNIALNAHAGADFTLTTGTSNDELVMTEGALRALIRATGDDQPEFLVGRIAFDGDLSDRTSSITITVNVTVLLGTVIPEAVERLRQQIRLTIATHTELTPARIDITVQDLDIPRPSGDRA